MPCWYYDKKDIRFTPSIRDGISLDTERRYRKEGARFIMSCGTEMGLGHNTIATGIVYFHRFYAFHSFKTFPRYVTACCCLFLAGKVEETPKKCKDIIKTARVRLSDVQFYSFGDDPKEEVMMLERILLQTIKFDLQVEHPYSYLLKYAKSLKGDQAKLQKMVQMAWNFVNDSLSTVVCLQWEPEIIAVALIHLASKLSKFTVVDWVGRQSHHNRWWDMFVSNVTMEILEDICHQVLDLYQSNQQEQPVAPPSPPQEPPSRVDSPPRGKGSYPFHMANTAGATQSKSRPSFKTFNSAVKSSYSETIVSNTRSVVSNVVSTSNNTKENVATSGRAPATTVNRQYVFPHGENNLEHQQIAVTYSRIPPTVFAPPFMPPSPYALPPHLPSTRGPAPPPLPKPTSKTSDINPWAAQFNEFPGAPPRIPPMPPMPPPRTSPNAMLPRQHGRASNQSGRMPAMRGKYYYQPYGNRQSRY